MELLPKIRKGFVLAVSAPSGTGKTSLCDRLAVDFSFVTRSVSVTTRAQREGEVPGKDYHFVTEKEFLSKKEKGEFLETAQVFGNWYGTLKQPVEKAVQEGKIVVMDIDTVGAFEVKRLLKDAAVLLFILPPSLAELEKRLRSRGKNGQAELEKRLKEAAREISEAPKYDFVIANHEFDAAYSDLKAIIFAERARPDRLHLA